MKRLFTFGLMLIGVVAAYAQTFYEVSYNDPGNKGLYMGLLTYTDDAHCKMRLNSYTDRNKNKFMEANYECTVKKDELNDSAKLVIYTPDDKKLPILVWMIEGDEMPELIEPPYVTFNLKKRNKWLKAISFREMDLLDMHEAYLRAFYTGDEPEYKNLVNGFNRVRSQKIKAEEEAELALIRERIVQKPGAGVGDPGLGPEIVVPEKPKLHLIVTANTNVSDIGMACMVDLNRVRSEFAGIAKVVGLQLDETIVANNDYSKEALVEAVNNLSPSESDVVVFVYSGHGFRFQDQKDFYPNMDLSPTAYDDAAENYLPLSAVYDSISVKGARLNIVLSDCCNSEIDLDMPIIDTNSLFSRSNKNFDRDKMRLLFLNSTGNIIATAASPGEVSWCGSNGGFFLLSVIESLRNQVSALNEQTPTWEMLIQNAIDAAAQKSENNHNCKKQNGLKFVKVKKIG
jgi:hypothetical protein